MEYYAGGHRINIRRRRLACLKSSSNEEDRRVFQQTSFNPLSDSPLLSLDFQESQKIELINRCFGN
jgi:hypothetical protein